MWDFGCDYPQTFAAHTKKFETKTKEKVFYNAAFLQIQTSELYLCGTFFTGRR